MILEKIKVLESKEQFQGGNAVLLLQAKIREATSRLRIKAFSFQSGALCT